MKSRGVKPRPYSTLFSATFVLPSSSVLPSPSVTFRHLPSSSVTFRHSPSLSVTHGEQCNFVPPYILIRNPPHFFRTFSVILKTYHNSITNSSFVPRYFSTPPRNMAPRRNPALPAVPETPTHSFVVQEPRFEDDPQDVEEVSEPAQDSTATLAEAITLMTAELKHLEPKKTNFKSNKPDTFDGSDPKKLNNFVLLCGLHFRSNPSSFDDDGAKVTFALSYLRGTALEFFEPSVLDPPEDCDWLEDWSAFVRTLRKDFGPIDPAADAEDSLDNLKMWENQRILKYNVEFNRLSILTGWKGPILKHRYYTGLAERIKDVIGQQGKPADLAELKSVAHAIDARHWERLHEKTRNDSKTPQKSDNKTNSNGNKSDNKSNNGSSSSKNKSNGSTNNNGNNNKSKSAK